MQRTVIGPIRSVPIAELRVPPDAVPCDQRKIGMLARLKWGEPLKPVTVVQTPDGPLVVGDQHALDIAKERGCTHVDCIFTSVNEGAARMSDIEHTIYYAWLTVLERAALIVEW